MSGTSSDGPRWIRHRPDVRERRATLVMAASVGLMVGGAVLYLTRLFAARERIEPLPRSTPRAPRPEGGGT